MSKPVQKPLSVRLREERLRKQKEKAERALRREKQNNRVKQNHDVSVPFAQLIKNKGSAMQNPSSLKEQKLHWDSLNNLHDSIANGLMQIAEAFADKHDYLREANQLNDDVSKIILTTIDDCEKQAKLVMSIKEKYKDKEGEVTEMDIDQYYSVGSEYHDAYTLISTTSAQAGVQVTEALAAVTGLESAVADAVTGTSDVATGDKEEIVLVKEEPSVSENLEETKVTESPVSLENELPPQVVDEIVQTVEQELPSV